MKSAGLFLILATILTAQPTPTEQAWVTGNNGGTNQYAQYQLLRGNTVGQAFNAPTLCPFDQYLSIGANLPVSPITATAANNFADSLILNAGSACIQANVNMDLFVNNSLISGNLASYDAAWQHILSDNANIIIRINATIAATNPGVTSQFTIDACNASMGGVSTCVTTPAPCSVSKPCFDTFAHFQAYFLGSSGPVATMLTRWGGTTAGQGLGANLLWLTGAHELLTLSCHALNPNWTSSSQCTAANWQAFGNAFVTLVRGIAGSTCTNCPSSATTPMNLGLTVLAGGDAVLYSVASCSTNCVCGAASTLNSCFVDIYPVPVNTIESFYATTVQSFINNVLCCNGEWGVEETIPANWVINNTPQSPTNSYRGNGNADWNRYATDRAWLQSYLLWVGSRGGVQAGMFDSFKLFWYTTTPSCPAGQGTLPQFCGTPNLNCGTDGTQCDGDISSTNSMYSTLADQLNNKGAGLTPLGLYWRQLLSGSLVSGAY